MTNRSRVQWSLAVALAAHALALAWTVRRARSEDAGKSLVRPTEVEIVVEAAPPAVAEAPPSAAEPAPVAAEPRKVASLGKTPRTTATPPDRPLTPGTPGTPVVSAEPGGGGSWTFSPTGPSAGTPETAPGAASADPLRKATAAGIEAVLAAAEKKAADRKRNPITFTARDMELGLAPGGQYVPLTRDRVRESLVPLEGHALLEFWTDSRGLVARIRVLSPSSDPRAWDDMASALAEDAHAAYPLKIPSNADGLIITLDVTSVMKTLSGASASRGGIEKVLSALQNPVDAVLDSKAVAQRVVAAKVVSVEAF